MKVLSQLIKLRVRSKTEMLTPHSQILKLRVGKKTKPNRTNPPEVKQNQTKSCSLHYLISSCFTQSEWFGFVWF